LPNWHVVDAFAGAAVVAIWWVTTPTVVDAPSAKTTDGPPSVLLACISLSPSGRDGPRLGTSTFLPPVRKGEHRLNHRETFPVGALQQRANDYLASVMLTSADQTIEPATPA
jgi:hypothetical protein